MNIKKILINSFTSAIGTLALVSLLVSSPAQAHDPVFGLGPHVLFKGGVEIAPQIQRSQASENSDSELSLELTYGLTGDWSAGVDIPYVDKSTATRRTAARVICNYLASTASGEKMGRAYSNP